MAIKVINQEVISNTYELKNIASLDATTTSTIQNNIVAGATGGSTDKIFWENDQTVTTSYTITNNQNAGSFGPITINTGVTVTIGDGETWTIA